MDINNLWNKYSTLNYLKDEFSVIYKKVENIMRIIYKNYICHFIKNLKYVKDTHTYLFYIIAFNVFILIFLCFLLFKYMIQNKKNNNQNKHPDVLYNTNEIQYTIKRTYPKKETSRKKKNEDLSKLKEMKHEPLQTLIDTKGYPLRNMHDQSEQSEYYSNNNKKIVTKKKTVNRKNKKEISPLDDLSLTQSFALSYLSSTNMDGKTSRRRSKRGKEKEENQKKTNEQMEKEIIIYSEDQKKHTKPKRSISKKKAISKNEENNEQPRSRSRKPRKR
ncbi:conserved Plasmodium protein, unknown function [Plasmodium chabaudi chabaudi]|uniref:Uncharacterized protein n=1 Tax=Plasmodium chabaudi chabaudi TaxID=31271 RepID=A0A1C6X9G5_PLACU|nr:conserved Plasmodium protein, unknown function [Plasmodium chabaudi chabaudi]